MAKVINCGHRGAMAYEPENTLRSFRRAKEMGADQIELDVFLTSDGVPVICHSSVLHTSPKGGNVRKMKYAEVKELTFHGEPVPTLQQAIDLCAETGLLINIEIKDRSSINATVDAIRKNNLHARCQVSNFHIGILSEVKRLDPKIPLGYIVLPFISWGQMKAAAALKCESVNAPNKFTDARYVQAAHKNGLIVYVWTANEPDDMRKLIVAGVDGIITNKPDVLAGIKKEMGVE